MFDGATKTTITKLPQHSFSNLYKTIFPRVKIVIVHNPIQNKWFINLNYLSKQIYVGVILKSDVNMPFVVITTNRKDAFEDLYRSQHHFWTYTSNLTTVVNSVLKFMISETTSILKS